MGDAIAFDANLSLKSFFGDEPIGEENCRKTLRVIDQIDGYKSVFAFFGLAFKNIMENNTGKKEEDALGLFYEYSDFHKDEREEFISSFNDYFQTAKDVIQGYYETFFVRKCVIDSYSPIHNAIRDIVIASFTKGVKDYAYLVSVIYNPQLGEERSSLYRSAFYSNVKEGEFDYDSIGKINHRTLREDAGLLQDLEAIKADADKFGAGNSASIKIAKTISDRIRSFGEEKRQKENFGQITKFRATSIAKRISCLKVGKIKKLSSTYKIGAIAKPDKNNGVQSIEAQITKALPLAFEEGSVSYKDGISLSRELIAIEKKTARKHRVFMTVLPFLIAAIFAFVGGLIGYFLATELAVRFLISPDYKFVLHIISVVYAVLAFLIYLFYCRDELGLKRKIVYAILTCLLALIIVFGIPIALIYFLG